MECINNNVIVYVEQLTTFRYNTNSLLTGTLFIHSVHLTIDTTCFNKNKILHCISKRHAVLYV